ncbi:MAG: triose-phosphate isomerase [Bacteroidales bacterium]|nr:triose-phosphate isomerase [Bacteroidales bacterium]
MRTRIAAGNWKMNTTLQDGIELAKAIQQFINNFPLESHKRVVLGIPFTHIYPIVQEVDYKHISVAAQNCAKWEKGAYTGEVSAEMIRSVGAHYIIIGHSERRQYFHETNEDLKTKVELCLKQSLRPIFCVGEKLDEREQNKQFEVVEKQLQESLFHLDAEHFSHIVIAYEPVWAIGTGKNATPQQAQEMHMFIRQLIAKRYSPTLANNITILYGGSCNAQNAALLFSQPDIDGGLIGGASLKTNEFIEIIKLL